MVACVVVLLVVVPLLDFAWNEPLLDQSPGVHCPLHANPGVALEPARPAVPRPEELLPLVTSPACRSLLGPSIFIPPRA